MCITNKFSEELLTDLRKLDKKEVAFATDKADILARIKFLQESLEEYETLLKLDLKVSLKETVYISEIGKKVTLAEGRITSEFNNKKVLDLLGIETYLKISSVQKGKVTELGDLGKQVIANAATDKVGEAYVTVSKMNKQELVEHKHN